MFGRNQEAKSDKLAAALAEVAIPGETADLAINAITDYTYVTDRGIRVVRQSLGRIINSVFVPWSQVQAAAISGKGVKTVQVVTAQSAFKVPAQQGDALRLLGAIQARMV